MLKSKGRGNLGLETTIYSLRTISFGLQIGVLLLFLLSLIVLKKKSRKGGMKGHGKIATGGYALALLSVLYMLYSAYNLTISGRDPSVIYTHGLFGAISLSFGFIFVINRWRWKTRRNMRILLALWVLTFIGGLSIYLTFTGRLP
ncbi:hypothetical protein [Methanosarcina siciliae]|uniref:hypothetical protein n=1 Tax=Methanosarcina siciliae TaxID=38027 RepID=UPI0011E5FB8B|nr:hypothetical protein [Methanosarcina siciliae]